MFLFHDFPSNTNPNFGKIIYRNFACGLHGGVDMTWSGGLLVLELNWRDCG
jgi:hypothetical protein